MAGVVPIANDSGGPREDIVVPEAAPTGSNAGAGGSGSQRVGYRCRTLAQYADAIVEVRRQGGRGQHAGTMVAVLGDVHER